MNGGRATVRVLALGCNNDNFNCNANYNNINNQRPARGNGPLFLCRETLPLKTYKHLFAKLCTWDNLADAYEEARWRKSNRLQIKEFDKHWQLYLVTLLRELRSQTYRPLPLKKFVLRDPKTRVICVSDFRDRIVHHALVNVLQPIFEPRFISDSYASRKGKGTSAALLRFDQFLRKVSCNGSQVMGSRNANGVRCFALKADIKHYFDAVDHSILLDLLRKRVKDEKVIWLVKSILDNYHSGTPGQGMPLGNWTSQFFANVYLNELDQFVKHQLRAKYYLRYVDDFVILYRTKANLQVYQQQIKDFLTGTLKLELHPTKCKIIPLGKGVSLLGFRVFYHYKLVRQRNVRKIINRLEALVDAHNSGLISVNDVLQVLDGWKAYALQGNTYTLRKSIMQRIKEKFPVEIVVKDDNRYRKDFDKRGTGIHTQRAPTSS